MASSLEPGVKVSRYSIVGSIGAGGMGEVYKAQDGSLERMVALKILPPNVVKNDERRRRFVQEARSASSLNHPHIVTIHEIGEAAVEETGQPIHYIAMELIDGSTLKQKIHQEQTDLRTLLGWLSQAADGLAKAHAAGIVHRDLKPENIMVTRDGFAKVLDFGLAKLSVRKSASDATDATLAREQTREGTVMGTVAYMSPEQVMGKVVDHRSDVFSFGAILYEAATRRRPFHADSDIDLMHSILHDKPEPVDQIAPSVPAEVRRMIRRCLAKDPERRYQSMKDLSIELREIADEYDELSASATSRGSNSQTAAVALHPRHRTAIWVGAAAALVAIAALTYVLVRQRGSGGATAAAAPPAHNALSIRRVTSHGDVLGSAISPDGRYVLHGSRDAEGRFSLRVRQVATGSDVAVVPPGEPLIVGGAFTPDGEYIYYARRDEAGGAYGWLYQIPSLGGPERKIVYDVDTAPAFSPDGRQIAFGRGVPDKAENHYLVVNRDGSGARVVARFPRFGANLLGPPSWSHDGRKLYVSRLVPPSGAKARPTEIDLATGQSREIGETDWLWINSVAATRDGKSLVLAGIDREKGTAQLWLQPLAGGQPHRLTNDFSEYQTVSLTADGNALAAVQRDTDGELFAADPGDATGGVPFEHERSRGVHRVSAARDGSLVYDRFDNGISSIVLLTGVDAQPRVLSTDPLSAEPTISADGKTIVYTTYSGDTPKIWATSRDGSGTRLVTSGEGVARVSPDGATVLYLAKDALWRVPVAGGPAEKVIDRPENTFGFSPDGSRIFFAYWKGGATPQVTLRVEPAAGGAPLFEGPTRGAFNLQWAPEGDGLTFVRASRGVANLFLLKFDGSEPVQLTKFRTGAISTYTWLPDGRLAYVRRTTRADVVLMTGLAGRQ